MSERPKIGVVVYGSVLNPADLRELFQNPSGRILPVYVNGFERVFNQEASWRETRGEHRAVLNLEQTSDRWFNGVLVADLSREEFEDYRERESGYRLIEVEQDEVEPYDSGTVTTDSLDTLSQEDIHSQHMILTTVGEKTDDDILPARDYLDICVTGASSWGDQFFADFLRTTMLNTGITLSEYLSEESNHEFAKRRS